MNKVVMQRQSAPPETNQALNGFACTMGVENYDLTEGKIIENGGKIAMPKYALLGMAWQGYYRRIQLAILKKRRNVVIKTINIIQWEETNMSDFILSK